MRSNSGNYLRMEFILNSVNRNRKDADVKRMYRM